MVDRNRSEAMKKTYIESIRERNAAIRMQVLNVLGWDDMQYAQLQEESGRHWIAKRLGNDVYMAEEITRHKEFWSWWRMHWTKRDQEFLEMASMLFADEVQAYYREIHSVETMGYYPHAALMDAAYTDMVHKLVKEAVR